MKEVNWNEAYKSGKDYRRMNLLLLSQILESSRTPNGAEVLDVGCGTGDLARKLANESFNVTALDSSSEAIETAKRKDGSVQYIQMSAEEISELSKKFDLIICKLVFAFLGDKMKFLLDAAELLKPGGSLVVITPVRLGDYEFSPHFQNISVDKSEAENLFRNHFQEVESCHTDYIDMDPYGAETTYVLKNPVN